MQGFYAEDGVQLFFISSEDRKKRKKTGGAGIASGEIRLEMKEQVLVEGLWDIGTNNQGRLWNPHLWNS